MKHILASALLLVGVCLTLPAYAGDPSAASRWGDSWQPPSAGERVGNASIAGMLYGASHGALATPGGVNYYGTVNVTNNNPTSTDSGATNVVNMNTVTASGSAVVSTNQNGQNAQQTAGAIATTNRGETLSLGNIVSTTAK